MKDDDKIHLYIHGAAEIIFLIFWGKIIYRINSYNADVHRAFHGQSVTFFNAFNFIKYNNYEGISLLINSTIMMIIVFVGTYISLRNDFSNQQTLISVGLLILNFILFIILIWVLANPILIAVFFAGIIGLACSGALNNLD